MKKVLHASLFKHLLGKVIAASLILCFFLFATGLKAQVIVETFEGLPWSTRTSSSLGSNVVTVAATASKQTITTYSGVSATQTATATTHANNSVGNYTWFYSKASISSASSGANSGHRKHSANLSYMMGSGSGYLIAPVLTGGVASISFWASTGGTSDLNVGVKTNTTNSSLSSSAVTLGMAGTAGFAAYTSITGLYVTMSSSQYVLTFSVTDPAQVVLYNSSGSTVYLDDIVIHTLAPDVALSSANPAITAGGIPQNSTANPVYSFTVEPDITKGAAALSSLSFTTTGTYSATDVSKFQLWYSKTNNITAAVQVGTDIVSSLGTGSHTFGSLNNITNSASIGYYWITTDVAVGATVNNTIAVSAVATSDMTFTSGTKTGSAFAGSSLTITAPTAATDYFRTKNSGNFSATSTWQSSADNATWGNSTLVPGSTATSVLIRNTHVVDIDQNATISSLTVGEGVSGTLQFPTAAATNSNYAFIVNGNVTVATGAAISASLPTNNNLHSFTIGGNLVVNGTYAFSGTSTSTKAINTNFTGSNVTISGTTVSTVALHTLSVNLASASSTITPSVNISTASAGISLNQGRWLQSSNTTTTAGGTGGSTNMVGVNAELVINGGTYTANGGSLSINGGKLTVSSGTLNVGSATGNALVYIKNGSTVPEINISGGAVNVAGRLSYNTSGGDDMKFTMSNGLLTVGTIGNSANTSTFDVSTVGSTFEMSGGTIIVQTHSSGGSTPVDFRNMATTQNITGGTVQFGNASTPAATTFIISANSPGTTTLPNVVLYEAAAPANSPGVIMSLGSITNIAIMGNLTMGNGCTFNPNGKTVSLSGNWINSGATFTNTGSTVILNGTGTQTITRSTGETFNNLTVNKSAGTLDLTASSAITVTGTLGLANGTVGNTTNNVTLGTGTTVDRATGVFAANPVYGTGVNVNYSGTVSTNSDKELTPSAGTIGTLSTSGSGGTYVLITSPSASALTVGAGSTLDAAAQVITVSGSSTISGTFRTAHASGVAGSIAGSGPNIGNASTIEYYSGTAQSVDLSFILGNLTLSGAGVKTFASSTIINGNFSSTGTNPVLPPGITFSGISGTQTIAGLAYNSVTINSPGATKQLAGPASIAADMSLLISAGTLDLGNNTLTLKSDGITGTARVASVGGSINYGTGGFIQERYIPAKASRTWSLVSSPFVQSIANSWQQQVHITGAGTGGTVCPTLSSNSNGFDATATNAASMFVYDGTKVVGSRWTSVTGTGINLAPGTGYRMNIRGPRSAGCSLLDGSVSSTTAATLNVFGTLSNANKNLYSFTINLANNLDASPANDNYLLAGNPYPSEISFSALQSANNTVINNSYAIFAPGNTIGNYAFWNGATFTGGNTGLNNSTGDIIANGQSFFVQGTVAGADIALNWTESMKTFSSNNGYFRQLNPNHLRIGYMLENGIKADEIMVQFANNATTYELNNEDVVSINAGTQYLKSLKGNTGLAFNTRNINFTNDTVRLNVVSSSNGNFKLSFYDFEQFVQGSNAKIYLMDNFTGTVQLMNDKQDYSFIVNTTVPSSQGKDRFAVVFSKPSPIAPLIPISSIRSYPNPATDQLTVELPTVANGSYSLVLTDITGKQLFEQKAQGTVTISTKMLKSGTYLLSVTQGKGEKVVQKIIKQ